MSKQVVLITGATSGFGLATALQFTRDSSYTIYAGYRRSSDTRDLFDFAKTYTQIHPMLLDVTKQADIDRVISRIIREQGNISCLINNAGYGLIGPIEDMSYEEMQSQFDVNFFGGIKLSQAVIPHMRKERYGRIIMVSSVNGKVAFPLYGMYAASKHALEAASESLAMEVAKFGIQISLVEPGMFRTDFWKNKKMPYQTQTEHSVYYDMAKRYVEALGKTKESVISKLPYTDPSKVADVIFHIARTKHPKFRYPIGTDSYLWQIGNALIPKKIKFFLARHAIGW